MTKAWVEKSFASFSNWIYDVFPSQFLTEDRLSQTKAFDEKEEIEVSNIQQTFLDGLYKYR